LRSALEIEKSGLINVMYDDRAVEDTKARIANAISQSNRILFMGFGFDEKNLSMLSVPNSLSEKDVFATHFRATNNEIMSVGKLLRINQVRVPGRIFPYDCKMLLREHLI
jgi:hypothetical protein